MTRILFYAFGMDNFNCETESILEGNRQEFI